MKRSTIFAVIAVCSMGAVATTVSAAELTNPTPTTAAEEAKMPAGVEFNNGPAGGGATLGTQGHIPSGGEFTHGPLCAAATYPTPPHMSTGAQIRTTPT